MDPNIILSGKNPVYEPMAVAAMRQQTLRNAIMANQHTAIVNPQIEAENRQKLAAGDVAAQQGQIALLTAQQDQEDAKNLRGYMQAASRPPAAPAANAGQLAGPQSAVLPGVVGVTPAPAPAAAQPQTWDDVADQFQGSGAQPRNVFAFRKLILDNKEKAATLAKTLADGSKTQAEVDEKTRDFEAGLANGVKDSGYNQVAMEAALHAADLYSPSSKAHVADIRRQMAAGVPIQSIIDPMVGAATAAQTTALARKASEQLAAKKQEIEEPGQKAAADQAVRVNNATKLAAARTPEDAQAILDGLPHGEAKVFASIPFDPKNPKAFSDAVLQVALTPEQRTAAAQFQTTAEEAHRHNLSAESTAKLNAAISGGHLAQVQLVNGLKYGPGTQEYWVKQLTDNPDSVKEMPPELRSSVGQAFRASTGLPLPTPLGGPTQGAETAARNALDGAAFIENALRNPEIRANLGPILGRLGNAEQTIGTSRLTPEAAKLAQELRTRVRYFVFQEGKAVLGGRMPQELMKQLEESSPNVRMTPAMLQGALAGARDNALNVMDNADKQRFGGAMRSRETRGVGATPAAAQTSGAHSIGDTRTYAGATYTFDGKQWVKQ